MNLAILMIRIATLMTPAHGVAYCGSAIELESGSLLCLETMRVSPAGSWTVDDAQEDHEPGDSIAYTVRY